ncbi:hypothetical protein [Flavobacterium sp. PS2]
MFTIFQEFQVQWESKISKSFNSAHNANLTQENNKGQMFASL